MLKSFSAAVAGTRTAAKGYEATFGKRYRCEACRGSFNSKTKPQRPIWCGHCDDAVFGKTGWPK